MSEAPPPQSPQASPASSKTDEELRAIAHAAHAEYAADRSRLDGTLAGDRAAQRAKLAQRLEDRRAASLRARAKRSDPALYAFVNAAVAPAIERARQLASMPPEEDTHQQHDDNDDDDDEGNNGNNGNRAVPFRHNYEARMVLDAVDAALDRYFVRGEAPDSAVAATPGVDVEGLDEADAALVRAAVAAATPATDPTTLSNEEILARVGDKAATVPRVPAWNPADSATDTRPIRADDVRALLSLLRGAAMVEAEEHAAGESQLMAFVDRFKGRDDLLTNLAGAWIDAHNRLGILWSNRSEPVKGLGYLREAERVYRVVRDKRGTARGALATAADPGPVAAEAAHDGTFASFAAAAGESSKDTNTTSEGESEADRAVVSPDDGNDVANDDGNDNDGGDGDDGVGPDTSADSAAVTPCVIAALGAVDDVESLYTHTAFYLAQCYGSLEPPQRDRSSFYCLLTLRRQMSDVTGRPGVAFNPVEWAGNCLSLSHYFTVESQYERADQCLQAARKVMPDTADREMRAKLAATCGRHYRNLLDQSRHRHLGIRFGSVIDGGEGDVLARNAGAGDGDGSGTAGRDRIGDDEVLFPTLALHAPKRAARTYSEAKDLFNTGMDYYNAALRTYVFDGFVTDHVTIVQDISAMYKSLAVFEPELGRRIAMQKRRIALLEPLLSMNPNAYHAIYKGLTYEVAEVYAEVADLLREKYLAECPDPKAAAHNPQAFIPPKKCGKVNEFVVKSIGMWGVFIKSFEHQGKLPDRLDEEAIDPFLHAHFHLARLHSRLLTASLDAQVANLTRALERYRYVASYVDEKGLGNMPEEVEICKQMIELIPLKLDRLKAVAGRAGKIEMAKKLTDEAPEGAN